MCTNGNHEIIYDDVYTEGQAKVHNITWKIANYTNFLKEKKTQEFRTKINKDLPGSNIQLKMKYLGFNNEVIDLYYVYPFSAFLKVSLSTLTIFHQIQSLVEIGYKTVEANTWMYIGRIKYNDLAVVHDIPKFVNKYGYLYLKFGFTVAINILVESLYVPTARLSNDLGNLLNDETFSDVTIKSVDGPEYKVHKVIIGSRSAVLKAYFAHNTTECITNIIESPFNAEVLQEVLIFIYSDRVPKIDDIPENLLAAADFYQLKEMKRLCEESLQKKLTFENAIEILQLADLYSANYLKEMTLEFIRNGHEKLIINSEGWHKLESAKLIKDIYERIILSDTREEIEFI